MKYWDEMGDKFGFSDGEALPPDVWKHREVYVKIINALAESRGSGIRVVCFDRGGVHNPCMVLLVEKKYVNDPDILAGTKSTDWEGMGIPEGQDEPMPDDILGNILDEMNDRTIDADECVHVDVRIDHDAIARAIGADARRVARARKNLKLGRKARPKGRRGKRG